MKQARGRRGIGGWIFLLLVVVLYAVVASVDAALFEKSLAFFRKIIGTVVPVLALVFVLLLAADLLLDADWVRRHLGRESGLKGWLMATLAGVVATGPIYPWYGLLREMREKGMRTSLIAMFLYSRAIKLPLLPLMVHYFGAVYTLVLCLYLGVFAIVSGVLTGWLVRQESH